MKPLQRLLYFLIISGLIVSIFVLSGMFATAALNNENYSNDPYVAWFIVGLLLFIMCYGVAIISLYWISKAFYWLFTGRTFELCDIDDGITNVFETIKTKKDYVKDDKLGALSFPERENLNYE